MGVGGFEVLELFLLSIGQSHFARGVAVGPVMPLQQARGHFDHLEPHGAIMDRAVISLSVTRLVSIDAGYAVEASTVDVVCS
jgi:hypothetical protein